MPANLEKLSFRTILARARKREISLVDVFEHHLDRIGRLNPKINALRFVDADGARRKIAERQRELEAGKPTGRLHGVLFSAKDSVYVKGMPRSDGSVRSSIENAPADSALAARLIAEGAVCIGKANMAESGKSYYSENPLFGRSSNPYNAGHTPGGSGGGDAAAVACDFVQFGLGADSGGSLRVPASFCGVFSLYPTRGTLSDAAPVGFSHTMPNLFRNAGPIAKSLDDLESLFHVLHGFDPNDHNSAAPPYHTLAFDSSRAGMRFAFFSELNGVRCSSEMDAALRAAAGRFEKAGFKGEEHAPPACAGAYEIFILLAGQASLMLDDLLAAESPNPPDRSLEGPSIKNLRQRIATELPPLTVENLLRAWHRVDLLRHMMLDTFSRYDFILAPVAAGTAPPHGTSVYEVDGQKLQSQQNFQFASQVNVLGLPAVAFPVAKAKNGLPIGLQIIGPRFSERRLFEVLRRAGFTERPADLIL